MFLAIASSCAIIFGCRLFVRAFRQRRQDRFDLGRCGEVCLDLGFAQRDLFQWFFRRAGGLGLREGGAGRGDDRQGGEASDAQGRGERATETSHYILRGLG